MAARRPQHREKTASGQDFVMMCVGNDNDVREVALGNNGAFDGMKKGATLSSITPPPLPKWRGTFTPKPRNADSILSPTPLYRAVRPAPKTAC